jgi:collagen type III alpha
MMFQRLDKNKDGKITADEVPDGAPDFVKEMLKRADKDGDKTVTAEEFRSSLPPFAGGAPVRPEARVPGRTPGPPEGRESRRPAGPEMRREGRPHDVVPARGMAPPGRPEAAGRGPWSSESRPDSKTLFTRLDKDGDQKLSPEEFAEGMKLFHSPIGAGQRPAMGPYRNMGRPPMMGWGPMGPRPGMGQRPAMGPHRGMMGRPPMMGRGPMGPRPGMGHGPAMGPHRGMMGRPPMMGRGPMRPQHAWGMHRGPMPGQAAAILGWLHAADKNKDGKLSKSEAPERLQQHFDKIDANKDGQLDKAELGKALAARGKQIRDSMDKRRAEIMKRMHEARGQVPEKSAHHKDAAAKKHAEPKKPIDKKVVEKKHAEKKAEKKAAEEKKPAEKKHAENKAVEKKVEEKKN